MKAKSHGRSADRFVFIISCAEKQNISAFCFRFPQNFSADFVSVNQLLTAHTYTCYRKELLQWRTTQFLAKFQKIIMNFQKLVLECESNFSCLVWFTVKKTMGLIDSVLNIFLPFNSLSEWLIYISFKG